MVNLTTMTDPVIERYARRLAADGADLPGVGVDRVKALRDRSMARFAAAGLPNRHVESWKYTDLRGLFRNEFDGSGEQAVDVAADAVDRFFLDRNGHCAVFVNGRFSASLSSLSGLAEGVRVDSLGDALNAGDGSLLDSLEGSAVSGRPGLAALNAAMMTDGVRIGIADGVTVDAPVQLLFLSSGENHLRNVITLGAGARATIIETHVSLGEAAGFTNCVTETRIGDGAALDSCKVQINNAATWYVALSDVHLGRDASWKGFVYSAGSRLAREEIAVAFDGEGSSCALTGLSLLDGRQHCDITTDFVHAKGRCDSNQMFKNVIAGRARSVYQGRVYVAQDAQQTNAFQMNRNLLLSSTARADSKPELIIHADDVKCGHGATVGELDREAMFYLQSRGISEAEARALLVEGFAAETIEGIECTPIREFLQSRIAQWLTAPDVKRAAA
jgi:Fe-S cluster assembly protein SufD